MDVRNAKLTIELVPSTTWFKNVRALVDDERWDILRRDVYKRAGYRCEICGAEGLLHCHEQWKYDDKLLVQELVGMQALCEPCHLVKHLGMAVQKGKQREAFAHLMKVNGWTWDDATYYANAAFDTWHVRSGFRWAVSMTWLEQCEKELGI